MKTLLCALAFSAAIGSCVAATSINLTNRDAFGANTGWINCRGDVSSGAVIGEYYCSGYFYDANTGWIWLGSGTPTNGIQYLNLSAVDAGVNCDATGHLRGYAYSGNIGWLAFESLGNPCVNLTNGVLSGHIYSANCGWISVSNAFAFVQTDSMPGGADTDGDGLADAWEWLSFGGLFASANADTDGDGTSNYQEYHAGTSPTNALDVFKITACSPAADGTSAVLQWNSVVTRKYRVLKSENFAAANWPDAGLGLITPTGATTTVTLSDSIAPARSFRVQAVRLLAP